MISQIELLVAIRDELKSQGMRRICDRKANAIIGAVNEIIAECERTPVVASPGIGLVAWLVSDDVGLSSKYMAGVLSGMFTAGYAHPVDSDDFGRCMRLLDAVPEFRERLGLLRDKSVEWAKLVESWDRIEAMMFAKKSKQANRLIMDSTRQ